MCVGKIYKADVGGSLTKRGFGLFIRMNEMKKLSCPGCEQCGWQHEYVGEACTDWNCQGILGMESVEDGKLYAIGITNVGHDWETGYVEEFDLEVTEYKLEKEK